MYIREFLFDTPKGMAEGVIAFEYVERSWLDKLLGRVRVDYGIGLCSPKDFNGRVTEVVDLGFATLTIEGEKRYIEGRTEEIARGRCEKGSNSGLAGTLTIRKDESLNFMDLYDLVHQSTPASWWRGA